MRTGGNVLLPLTDTLLAMATDASRERATIAPRAVNQWGYALCGRGHVLAAGGLVPIWPGRAVAWLLVGREARPRDLVPALRHARAVMDKRQRDPMFRRIEAFVRADAPWRESFVKALGMTDEQQLLGQHGPDGADYFLCARIAGQSS